MAKATRMAFICKDDKLYFKYYTFDYFGGFAISQKRKNISSFHNVINQDGIDNILEVSRRNENELGVRLSAFNLIITLDNIQYPVECLYQSSKVFGNIRYEECKNMKPYEAKKFIKEKVDKDKLALSHFDFNNKIFPLDPKSLFYDYLYIYALNQNQDLAIKILDFDCYTDIEFNHCKQFASQARSCALYKYLYNNKLIDSFLNNPIQHKKLYISLQENTLI